MPTLFPVLALGLLLPIGAYASAPVPPLKSGGDKAAIGVLNTRFEDAIRKMDNAAVLTLWAKDGISLLPGMAPLIGRDQIAHFMEETTRTYGGWRVLKHEAQCQDIRVQGPLATEWCSTFQTAQPPGGKSPIEIRGRMLLVLTRGFKGGWQIQEEMWSAAGPKGS